MFIIISLYILFCAEWLPDDNFARTVNCILPTVTDRTVPPGPMRTRHVSASVLALTDITRVLSAFSTCPLCHHGPALTEVNSACTFFTFLKSAGRPKGEGEKF